jgi:hypothetical protein
MRTHETHETNGDSNVMFADPPSPRPVTTTRRRSTAGAHAEKRPTPDHSAARWQPRIAATDEPSAADAEPDPVPVDVPTASFEDGVRPIHPEVPAVEPAPLEHEPVPEPVLHEPAMHEQAMHEPAIHEPAPVQHEHVLHEPMQQLQHEPMPVPVEQEPSPTMSGQAPLTAGDPAAEADLSNRERELLRQLHEELAKREQSEPEPTGWQDRSGHRRPVNPPGAEFNPADFRQPEFNPNEFGGPAWHQSSPMLDAGAADQTAVNGIPPYGSVQ